MICHNWRVVNNVSYCRIRHGSRLAVAFFLSDRLAAAASRPPAPPRAWAALEFGLLLRMMLLLLLLLFLPLQMLCQLFDNGVIACRVVEARDLGHRRSCVGHAWMGRAPKKCATALKVLMPGAGRRRAAPAGRWRRPRGRWLDGPLLATCTRSHVRVE